MIDAKTPPDLVLDLTEIGIQSEMVKTFSLNLGLPTVSSSLGEDYYIRYLTVLFPQGNICFMAENGVP